jgi:hypothetical protein
VASLLVLLLPAVLVAGGATGTAALLTRWRRRAREWGPTVPGVVVGVESHRAPHGGGVRGALHAPVLAFRTRDGREVRTVSRVAVGGPAPFPGQPVVVRYDAADPGRAQVDGAADRFGTVAVVAASLVVGVALAVLVVVGFVLFAITAAPPGP